MAQITCYFIFLSYNFVFVFRFGSSLEVFHQVRSGFFSVCIGSLMLLSTLLIIPFPEGGVSEILYIQLIAFWNLFMLYKGNKELIVK